MGVEKRITELTDSLDNIHVNLNGKILLYTYVAIDGIGDLMLQIRMYNELNALFPGQIKCVTCCEQEHMDTIQGLMQVNHFSSELHDIDSYYEKFQYVRNFKNIEEIVKDDLDLILLASCWVKAPSIFFNHAYALREMYSDTSQANQRDPTLRVSQGTMSFFPAGEGLWHDDIPQANDNTIDYLLAAQKLKSIFNAPEFSDQSEAKTWFNNTWISQSQSYELNFFLTTLVAQASYLDTSKSNIERIVIKANLKNRNGEPWTDLKSRLETDPLKSELVKFGIGKIVIDNEVILLSSTAAKTITISSKKIAQEDYPQFLNLMNGVAIPGGDNTYSEAFSNVNAKLPPFLELRLIKYEVLNDLINLIQNEDSLSLDDDQRKWLSDIFQLCFKINEAIANAPSDKDKINDDQIIEWARQLDALWSSSKVPKQTWTILSQYIADHSLNKRLPAIIKEQIIIRRCPDLVQKKNTLIVSPKSTEVLKMEFYNSANMANNNSEKELKKSLIECLQNNDEDSRSMALKALNYPKLYSTDTGVTDALFIFYNSHNEYLYEDLTPEIINEWLPLITRLINGSKEKLNLFYNCLLKMPIDSWGSLFNQFSPDEFKLIIENHTLDEICDGLKEDLTVDTEAALSKFKFHWNEMLNKNTSTNSPLLSHSFISKNSAVNDQNAQTYNSVQKLPPTNTN